MEVVVTGINCNSDR